MKKRINIIGAGLAGCEAAWQLAKREIDVRLFEIKRVQKNPVQKLDSFAELVCSNTLRSLDNKNAVGTLKEEMKLFDSLILEAAYYAQIPAGGSLAVDREKFSNYITNKLESNKYIEILDEEKVTLDDDEITLIASGPLTTDNLQNEIIKLLGKEYFYFYDAVAPIIKKDTINMDICFRKNRYDKGETEAYINCPMSEEEYKKFHDELVNAQLAEKHLDKEKNLKFFEGCMPVEVMAKRGFNTLRFGPLKPAGLSNIDGSKNFAVVQLRQDNAKDDLYNMVGFQTNLTWKEQKRVFQLIPGLEKAEFVRYGVMHLNNFINSPALLNNYNQLKTNKNIFFAGQITGVEGYVESCSSGIIAAINIYKMINDEPLCSFPKDTVMGALQNYIITTSEKNFQPMKANWSLVENMVIDNKLKKEEKRELYSQRAISSMKEFIKKNNIL